MHWPVREINWIGEGEILFQDLILESSCTCFFAEKHSKVNPDLIHVLELEKTKLLPLDDEGKEMLSVTPFDANHCPGSVMLLFSAYFGNILYTGDFRYSTEMFSTFRLPVIDVLYLDNTYCSKKCDFYSREYATNTIIERLQNCLKTSDCVMLGVDNLGKEELMKETAEKLNIKICVEEELMKTLEILGLGNIATTDPKNCTVFAVNTSKVNGRNMIKWNKMQTTCAIIPTARYCGLGFIPFTQHSNIHIIPYSNHSSFLELQDFVKKVHPCSIVPIIDKNSNKMMGVDVSSRSDMSIFFEFTNMFASKNYIIPESVKKYMSTPLICTEYQKKKKLQKLEPRILLPKCDKGVNFINSFDSNECKNSSPVKTVGGDTAECTNLDSISIDKETVYTDKDKEKILLDKEHHNQESVHPTCTSSNMWELLHITSFAPPKITVLSTNDIHIFT